MLFAIPGIAILFLFINFLYPKTATCLELAVNGLVNNRAVGRNPALFWKPEIVGPGHKTVIETFESESSSDNFMAISVVIGILVVGVAVVTAYRNKLFNN